MGAVGDLDFADGVLLLAHSMGEAQRAVDALVREGLSVALELNAKKTISVSSGPVWHG